MKNRTNVCASGFPILWALTLVAIIQSGSVTQAQDSGVGYGLVGYWSFDEGAGSTVNDSSGNGRVGTLTNDPAWAIAKIGAAALFFDGVNDFVDVQNFVGFGGSDAATVSLWVCPAATNKAIISQWSGGRLFEIDSISNRFVVYWRHGGSGGGGTTLAHTTPPGTLSLNEWQHITFTYQNGTSSFYRDGVLVSSAAGGGTLNDGITSPLRIGWNNLPSYVSGAIDDVRIYNRALDAGDVQAVYTFGSVPDTTPPSVSVSVPSSGAAVSGAITISVDAIDDVGVVAVQFAVDGVNLGAEDTAAPYETLWDTATVPNGSYTIMATARDAASNTATSEPVKVTVLNVPHYALSVSRTGSGSGIIVSSPAGINCGADCAEVVPVGSQITLEAIPSGNATFDGWSGACAGTGACILDVSAHTQVTALFTALPGTTPRFGQAYEWGNRTQFSGRAAALGQLPDAVLMSGNSDWSLALRADGTLVAWGSNRYGQLNVPAGPHDRFVHAAAGWRHGIACRTDGSVEEWGTPYGKTEAEWEAQRPPVNSCVQVAAGDDHSAALLADGTVVTWGGRAAVTRLSGQLADVTQIASGWYAVIALHRDGRVTVFGAVSNPGEYLTPPPGTHDIVKVAASQFSFYAIKSDGTPVAWGSLNTYGQLTPPPDATDVIDIAGGRYHTIALRSDGTVIVWGDNSVGQLDVPTGMCRVIAVGSGRYYSQAIGVPW